MRRDRTGNLRDVQHAFLAFFHKELVQLLPDLSRTPGCANQERFITFVWLVVLLDEIANVDLFLPKPAGESLPCWNFIRTRERCFCGRHVFSLRCVLHSLRSQSE